MKAQETRRILELLLELYPNFKVGKESADIWNLCLADTSYEKAKENIVAYAKLSPYTPTVADVLGIKKEKKRAPDDWCEVTGSSFKLVDFRRPEEGVK
jgi:hypothetical protein